MSGLSVEVQHAIAEIEKGPHGPDVGAFFDLDGTLVDHEGAVVRALHDWLPRIGVAPDAVPPLVSTWFAAEERHFASWRSGEISFAEQRRRRLRDVLPLIGRSVPDDAELPDDLGLVVSTSGSTGAPKRAMLTRDALRADLEQSLPLVWGRPVHTVFLGGGTPSLFPPETIDRFLQGGDRLRILQIVNEDRRHLLL